MTKNKADGDFFVLSSLRVFEKLQRTQHLLSNTTVYALNEVARASEVLELQRVRLRSGCCRWSSSLCSACNACSTESWAVQGEVSRFGILFYPHRVDQK